MKTRRRKSEPVELINAANTFSLAIIFVFFFRGEGQGGGDNSFS